MVEDNRSKQPKYNEGGCTGKGWKPGQSGNPGGRPKDPGITAIQIKLLDKKCPYDAKGRTWREYLAEKGLLLAVQKEMALEHLKERLEGKVATIIATPDEEGRPSKLEIVIVNNKEVDK